MIVRYSLSLEGHFAWYDYYCTTSQGKHEKSKIPIIGKYLDRLGRESFGRTVSTKGNETALGERSLELSVDGAREFFGSYDFLSRWSDIAFVATTSTHLFIAHANMNSHIVPLHAFRTAIDRDAFVRCAEVRGASIKKEPNQAAQTTPGRRPSVSDL